MFRLVVGLGLLSFLQSVAGECANACNGHGKCTSYDMCICNRNWQAADCSERVCQFGLAHVDTPKGDLDGSGTVLNANSIVIENNYVYPYGTTEQFPSMQNSDLQTLSDSAHYYMECSNKGRCDRSTGECQCFDGYDGVACQRASCPGFPNSCSGHGICKTISQLANEDNGNVYKLWDQDSTMGCDCDPGFTGPDCSQRVCKVGVDPLYLDDAATIKYSQWDVGVLTTRGNASSYDQLFTDGEKEAQPGYWALRVFDSFGEDWLTQPLVAGATCAEITEALYNIPNNVIPPNSVYCTLTKFLNGTDMSWSSSQIIYRDAQHPTYRLIYKTAIWEDKTEADWGELSQATPITLYEDSNSTLNQMGHVSGLTVSKLSGYIYRLKFYGNPGALREPEVEVYLDGKRPTLISENWKVVTKVWTDGQQGEYNDYFADYCDGVTTTIGTKGGASFLTGFTLAEKNLLKKCLGGSDFNVTNNVDVYNWDRGTKFYPHIVKLVRTVTTYTDGGYYAVIWYDTNDFLDNTAADGTFKIINPFYPPDALATDNYNVYTTQGVLALTSEDSQLTVSYASKHFFSTNITYDVKRTDTTAGEYYDGDLSCEVGENNAGKLKWINYCLNKGDLFTYLNWEQPFMNPPHINLYTVERLYTGPFEYSSNQRFATNAAAVPAIPAVPATEMHFMTHMITTDLSANWGVSVGGMAYPNTNAVGSAVFHAYKFFPATASTYNYVGECSNRGLCDRDTGVCKCFPGYTNDNCDAQSSLAV